MLIYCLVQNINILLTADLSWCCNCTTLSPTRSEILNVLFWVIYMIYHFTVLCVYHDYNGSWVCSFWDSIIEIVLHIYFCCYYWNGPLGHFLNHFSHLYHLISWWGRGSSFSYLPIHNLLTNHYFCKYLIHGFLHVILIF